MAIGFPDDRQLKDRPEPRDTVNSPETSSDHDTHHDLNSKTRVASNSLRSSPSSLTLSSLTSIRTLFTTLPSLPLSSPIWTFLEHLYHLPNPPPPRVRDLSRPMSIICVGFRNQSPSQPVITRADFEELLGHCQAVTDAPASVFAAELIAAYPEAKVVLNMRREEEKWQESLVKTIIKANESWGFWIASWLDRECFWAWHVYERFLWPSLFRCVGGYGELSRVVRGGGGMWVWREHCNMIRGLVPPDRLLEWYIEDGWEPLCKFLGKGIPDLSFPHANAAGGGWKAREEQCNKRWVERAFINLFLILVRIVSLGVFAWWWWWW